jgi:hypothetical protein
MMILRYSAVNFPAVTDFQHKNREHLIIEPTDQAIVTDSVTNQALQFTGKNFAEQPGIRRLEKPFVDEA